jgi:hypothetical protein
MSTATIKKRGTGTQKPKKIPLPRTPKMVDTKYLGLEPELEGLDLENNDVRLTRAYTWYNHFFGPPEAKKWAVDYYTKVSPATAKTLQRVPEAYFSTTVGWLCRMKDRGTVLPTQSRAFLQQKLLEMTQIAERQVEKKAVKAIDRGYTPPPQDAVIAEVEAMLDSFYASDYSVPFDMYDYLQKNDIKKGWAKAIAEYYRPVMAEIRLLMTKKDKDLNEAYAKLTKKQIDTYLKQLYGIIEDSERWYANKAKTIRTARAPKKKSTEQLLKYFKHMKDMPALKVVSIDPASIIGASTLYAYNHKYKKLIVYTAKGGETLSIKGTSIVNYDESKVQGKNLRKPEVQLQTYLNGTAAFMKKRYEEINSKPSIPSGRISEDVLLLKVFK